MGKLLAHICVKDGMCKDFIKYATAVKEHAVQEAGCLLYEVYQLADNKNEFYLLEEWRSEEYFIRHLASSHARAFENRVKEIQAEELQPILWEKIV